MSWMTGIGVGGTFAKVPTTPQNQAFGVLNALSEAERLFRKRP